MTDIIKYLSGPVIGSVIGYFTNYIAVKMLFRPYREIKIFNFRLPFTPGIIPKRRGDLARAIGKAISETLFTSSDLEKTFLSEDNIKKLSDIVISKTESEKSIAEIIELYGIDSNADNLVSKVSEAVTDKLVTTADRINVGKIITEIAQKTIEDKKQSLGMFSFILNDSILNPLLESFEGKINVYIRENGKDKFRPTVEETLFKYSKKPISELTAEMDKEKTAETIADIIRKSAPAILNGILSEIDIAGTVEKKINGMDIAELENLCLSVMQKELNAIVNLGALIGFIIGTVNSFI